MIKPIYNAVVIFLAFFISLYNASAYATGLQQKARLSEQEVEFLKDKEKITIAIAPIYPVTYWNRNPVQPEGFFIEILEKLSVEMDISFEYVNIDSLDTMFDALKNGTIDVVVAYGDFQSRVPDLLTSKMIFQDHRVSLVKKDKAETEPKRLKWGCFTDSFSCDYLTSTGAEKINKYDDAKTLFNAFSENKVDAILARYSLILERKRSMNINDAKIISNERNSEMYTKLILRQDNEILKGILNKNINHLNENDYHWIYLTTQKSNYNAGLYGHFVNSKKLNVKYTIDDDIWPLSYVNLDGQYVGLMHDIMELISSRSMLNFSYVPPFDGKTKEQMLDEGSVDLIVMKENNKNNDKQLFSIPYMILELVYIQVENYKGKENVAIVDKGKIFSDDKDFEPFTNYSNVDDLTKDLANGKVSRAYMIRENAQHFLYNNPHLDLEIVTQHPVINLDRYMYMSSRKENYELINRLNSVLNTISEKELDAIWANHRNVYFNWGVDKKLVKNYSFFSVILILLSLYFIYIMKRKLDTSAIIISKKNEMNSWLSLLIDSMPNMICIFDKDGNIKKTNLMFQGKIGEYGYYEPNLFIKDLFLKDLASMEAGVLISCNVLERGSLLYGKCFEVIKNNVVDTKGNENFLIAFEDVTEKKNSEKKLITLNKQINQSMKQQQLFVAVTSHELKTPLSAILGLLEVLVGREDNPGKLTILENIHNSTNKLKLLVNDILDYSKIDANRLTIVPEPTDLAKEISSTLRGFEASAKMKGIGFVVDWTPSPYLVATIDGLRMTQVISNVLSNAVKFTERGVVVTKIKVESDQLYISILDTGIGMDEKHLETIFIPFRQAEEDIARRFGGTGLGMSIVYNLVELMGGRIEIKSEIGMGTQVSISFPVKAESTIYDKKSLIKTSNNLIASWLKQLDVEYQLDLPIEEGNTNVYPDSVLSLITTKSDDGSDIVTHAIGRVLVIDDDPVNCFLIKQQLELIGVDYVVLNNAQQALDMLDLDHEDFDMVITDYHMPNINGFELAAMIRKMGNKFSVLPILACTADNSDECEQYAYSMGVSDILFKPYTVSDLMEKLNVYLDSSEKTIKDRIRDLYPGDQTDEMCRAIEVSFNDSLNQLIQANCDDDMKMVAHRLKGSAQLIDMDEIAKVAMELEREPGNQILKDKLISILGSVLDNINP